MAEEVSEENSARLTIRKVKEISFQVNEQAYIDDPAKAIKIELGQNLGFNLEHNLINFRFKIFIHYIDTTPVNILAEIEVQNLFELTELKSFLTEGGMSLPPKILLSIISMSISHARALFAKNLYGTVFQEIILPITNPIEVARHFFPNVNFETPEK